METVFHGALFDLDEVVVATGRHHREAWRRLAEEEKLRFDDAMYKGLRGRSRTASLEIILDHNDMQLPFGVKEALASRKNAYLVEQLCTVTADDIRPGVQQTVTGLRRRGVTTALISLSRNAGIAIEKLGLRKLFDYVYAGQETRLTEFEPALYKSGAELVGAPPHECLAFESFPQGIRCAAQAGVNVIGVGTAEDIGGHANSVESLNDVDIDALLRTGQVAKGL